MLLNAKRKNKYPHANMDDKIESFRNKDRFHQKETWYMM